ncbi:MAG: LPS export ABC transporter permease LptF [Desulfuromonadaceae bacterium]|nr:LPS export ABC transporter permease LptF [Desulfuromonadaceae bacterium]MDD2856007.1 LPS export ABC transporter permease LptF [Desulfuromonadaceae bacterium]
MKRILSLYIIREISSLFLLGIVIFTVVLLMGRLLSLTDMVVSYGVPLADVGRMVLYLIPSFLVMTIPMAFLLAVLMAFGRLSADNEIVVLKASGISLFQMLPPVIFCSLIAMLLSLGASTIAAPWGNSSFKKLTLKVLTENVSATIREKTFWADIPGIVMYTDRYDEENRTLKGVIIHDGRNPYRQMTIFAKQGVISAEQGSQSLLLSLQDGSIHSVAAAGAYRLINFGEYSMTVGDKGGKRDILRGESDMTMSELESVIEDPSTVEANRLKKLSEYHSRFTFPFASIVFALLAVPLGIQNRRAGKSAGFTISILIILSYYILMSVVKTVAEKGGLPAFIALWIPNLLFLSTGLIFLRMASMEKVIPLFQWGKILNLFRKSP